MQSVNNFKFKSIPLDLSGIAFDMAEGSLTEIKEIFFIEGKYSPIIRWCSFSQSDWPKPHQIVCDFWRLHFSVNTFTENTFNSEEALVKIKPYIAILAKQDTDYCYEYMGDRYADFHKLNKTKTPSILDSLNEKEDAISLFNYTALTATGIRGQGLLCLYQSGTDTHPELWNKLILPLSDSKGIAKKFIVCALKSPS
jgi:hypothetical protein